MAVTPISELREYAEGMEVELPGFVEEKPIVVKLRRPSMLLLAQEGVIFPTPCFRPHRNFSAAARRGKRPASRIWGKSSG